MRSPCHQTVLAPNPVDVQNARARLHAMPTPSGPHPPRRPHTTSRRCHSFAVYPALIPDSFSRRRRVDAATRRARCCPAPTAQPAMDSTERDIRDAAQQLHKQLCEPPLDEHPREHALFLRRAAEREASGHESRALEKRQRDGRRERRWDRLEWGLL